jgi:hypothetical protein
MNLYNKKITLKIKRAGISLLLVLTALPLSFGGPPFNTDDPQPVDFRHWEYYVKSDRKTSHHLFFRTYFY